MCTVLSLPIGAQQTGGLASNIIVEDSANESDFPIVSIKHAVASLHYYTSD
jgi:hypothetical protein